MLRLRSDVLLDNLMKRCDSAVELWTGERVNLRNRSRMLSRIALLSNLPSVLTEEFSSYGTSAWPRNNYELTPEVNTPSPRMVDARSILISSRLAQASLIANRNTKKVLYPPATRLRHTHKAACNVER